ncbi:MAG: LacI family DNA-binding transcriptional regulator [Victivallaceae bacterium]
MTTMRDIAAELDLAVSVVSRALDGNPERHRMVAEATWRRVLEAAARLDSRRNPAAATLRWGGNIGIGVWLTESRARLAGMMAKGVGEGAMRENLPLFLSIGYTEDVFSEFVRVSRNYAQSGLISYAAPFIRFPALAGELERYCRDGGKMVLLSCYFDDFRIPGAAVVGIDDFFGGELVGVHLRERGVEELFFVGAESKRYRGVCRGYGRELPRLNDVAGAAGVLAGVRTGGRLAGLAAGSDAVAAGLERLVLERGLVPGRDVLITGYNDSEVAELLPYPLTTVRQDMYAVGLAAVQSLVKLAGGKTPEDVLIKPELVIRATA